MPQSEMQGKKKCLVLQGFGEKIDLTDGRKLNLDASYQVIKDAVEEAGLQCLRADEIIHSGLIDFAIYEQILHADLVIADLSTYNLNAAYELGIRYGLKPYATIIVAEEKFKNPFDVSHMTIHYYRHLGEDIGVSEARRFKAELKDAIAEIIDSRKTDSPIYTFLTSLRPPMEDEGAEAMTEAIAAELPGQQEQTVKELCNAAHDAMKNGDYSLARMVLQAIREKRPHDDNVVQQLALATYKSRRPNPKTATDEARTTLKALNPESSNDPETLGLWAAVHRRLWELTAEPSNLDESIGAYERGFCLKAGLEEKGDYLKQLYRGGIHLALLLNVRSSLEEKAGEYAEAVADFILARRVRREVLRICRKALDEESKADSDPYWMLAAMWEAAAGLEDDVETSKCEQKAKAACSEGWMLESTQSHIEKLKSLLLTSPLKHLR